MSDFAERYRVMSDAEVMNLYMQRDSLVAEAREAIAVEFANRKLSEDEATDLRQDVVRDYRETMRKQSFIARLLFGRWIQRG